MESISRRMGRKCLVSAALPLNFGLSEAEVLLLLLSEDIHDHSKLIATAYFAFIFFVNR